MNLCPTHMNNTSEIANTMGMCSRTLIFTVHLQASLPVLTRMQLVGSETSWSKPYKITSYYQNSWFFVPDDDILSYLNLSQDHPGLSKVLLDY